MDLSIIKISLSSLWRNRLRSFLTIAGIVIGIMAVIIVFSAGEGLRGLIMAQVASWGSDFIEVEPKVPAAAQNSTANAMGQAGITTLKNADAAAIAKVPNIKDVYSTVMGQAVAGTDQDSDIVQLWGTTASFLNIDSGKVATGRFFTDDEDKSLARVAVLGSSAKTKFFGDSDPIGKSLKIGKHNFKVIGVMAGKGAIMYMDMDKFIYLPLTSLQKLIMGINHVSFVVAKLKNTDLTAATADDLKILMRERHNITDPDKEDFAITTMVDALDNLNKILGGISLLLIAIAAVSLIVGGVGIMNIMLVSVTERTNEIGLRKAVGASEQKIMLQFLWEAVFLTFIGGIIGIIFGIGLSFLVSVAANSQGFNWAFVIKPMSLVWAVGVSVLIGLGFGLYPAQKAAKMDPIEALRFE
ncbi:MAG: ABC transporter permease [Candidatus Komeilibacteria bacterium]|nr:ABC transporter permease [Candidatus Komeilibacteria bacterium]